MVRGANSYLYSLSESFDLALVDSLSMSCRERLPQPCHKSCYSCVDLATTFDQLLRTNLTIRSLCSVTTTSESFAPDPPNPSSSTGAGGTATTGSPGAAPTGSQAPGDDAAPSRATRSGLVAVVALTLGWLASL